MSLRKYNKTYTDESKGFIIRFLKDTSPNIKKLRARNWLKARKEELLHEFKSNY